MKTRGKPKQDFGYKPKEDCLHVKKLGCCKGPHEKGPHVWGGKVSEPTTPEFERSSEVSLH